MLKKKAKSARRAARSTSPPVSAEAPDFRSELCSLINKHSLENGSNTPDFILSKFLADGLTCFNQAVRRRAQWYGHETAPGSGLGPLFEHLRKNHGLTLPDDELMNIAQVADESRLRSAGGVAWILVNALRHLSFDELHDLGDAIAKRSGGAYLPERLPAKTP